MTEQGIWEDRRQDVQSWRGVPARGISVALAVHVERLLGDALPWAQACAMMLPPFGPGLADALRRRFHPELPPERIERFMLLPGITWNSAGLRFSTAVLALLRQGFLVRRDDREQQAVLEFLLDQIREAEPGDKNSLEHLAWEWRLERVRPGTRSGSGLEAAGRTGPGTFERVDQGGHEPGEGGESDRSGGCRNHPAAPQT